MLFQRDGKKESIEEGLGKELEKRNATIVMLQESLRRLIREKEKRRIQVKNPPNFYSELARAQRPYIDLSDRHQNEVEATKVNGTMPDADTGHEKKSEMAEYEKQARRIAEAQKRRTSIDALDLHGSVRASRQRSPSQIDKFRDKFWEYQRSSELPNRRRAPQQRKTPHDITGHFRHKLREYCEEHRPTKSGRNNEDIGRLRSYSENGLDVLDVIGAETPLSQSSSFDSTDREVVHFLQNSGTCGEEDRGARGRNGNHMRSTCTGRDKQNEVGEEVKAQTQTQAQGSGSSLSLYTLLENRKLVMATLSRQDGETWGIELAHVTETGPSRKSNKVPGQENKVVYVVHQGQGRNAILSSKQPGVDQEHAFLPISIPIINTPSSGSPSESADDRSLGSKSFGSPFSSFEHDSSSEDLNNINKTLPLPLFHHNLLPHGSPLSSRPGSATIDRSAVAIPVTPRPSSALAQWRKDGSPETRPGVWVAGVTEEGVAVKDGQVHVDDLIVEVSAVV